MATFPLAEVLSVTTSRLVSDMDGVYHVLDFMAGESLMTHQLPRVCREAAPVILAQHPELADVVVPETIDSMETAAAWVATVAIQIGADSIDLTPMAPGDHESIDPLAELTAMRPDMPVIVVVPEEDV